MVSLNPNGEIKESLAISTQEAEGHWSVKADKSSWLALLVRGHYADKQDASNRTVSRPYTGCRPSGASVMLEVKQ